MLDEYDFSKGKRGAVIASPGETRITMMLDDEVLRHFRDCSSREGLGDQTTINASLRAAMQAPALREDDELVTVGTLRRVLRETLK